MSGNGVHRPDVFRMSAWLDGQLKGLGVTTKLVDLGKHVMDGQELPLPPAILGRIGDDPKKKTVLVYGHYDVQPVCLADHNPFPPTAIPSWSTFALGSCRRRKAMDGIPSRSRSS